MTDYMGRTLTDAIETARKREGDLPHIVQVLPSDYDTIIMADCIAALIAAGDKLAEYARHNYACGAWWEEGRICDCGYTEAVKAWKELTK